MARKRKPVRIYSEHKPNVNMRTALILLVGGVSELITAAVLLAVKRSLFESTDTVTAFEKVVSALSSIFLMGTLVGVSMVILGAIKLQGVLSKKRDRRKRS